MKLNNALLVFEKDWTEVKRNWEVILPIIILPILFSLIIPLLFFILPTQTIDSDFLALIANLPENIKTELLNMTPHQVMIYVLALYFFTPFFLIIPIMTSSVIASDSFAGEKERKTIEGLLATPLSDGELILGKVFVSFIPSMIVTILAFLSYCISVDLMGIQIFDGRLLLPNLNWILLIICLSPTISLTTIGLTVIISAKVKGFREAQQISILLILPVIALLIAQASGIILIGPFMIILSTIILMIFNLVLFRVGLKIFKREEILSQTK